MTVIPVRVNLYGLFAPNEARPPVTQNARRITPTGAFKVRSRPLSARPYLVAAAYSSLTLFQFTTVQKDFR